LQFFLQGPDFFGKPFHQRHIVGIAAQKGHGRVGVAVDETGQGHHFRTIYDAVRLKVFRHTTPLAYRNDGIPGNSNFTLRIDPVVVLHGEHGGPPDQ
jgi:hypothetical protein